MTIYSYAVPIVAGVAAWAVFGEALTPTQIVSGVLTLGGMLLARWAIGRGQQRAAGVTAQAAEQVESIAGAPVAQERLD